MRYPILLLVPALLLTACPVNPPLNPGPDADSGPVVAPPRDAAAPIDDCDRAEANLYARQCRFPSGKPTWITHEATADAGPGKPFGVVCRQMKLDGRIDALQINCLVALADCAKVEAAYAAKGTCP